MYAAAGITACPMTGPIDLPMEVDPPAPTLCTYGWDVDFLENVRDLLSKIAEVNSTLTLNQARGSDKLRDLQLRLLSTLIGELFLCPEDAKLHHMGFSREEQIAIKNIIRLFYLSDTVMDYLVGGLVSQDASTTAT